MRRRVRDVMTRDVVTVDEETPFEEFTQLLADCHISAMPVLDSDARVVGVVSEADLLLKEEFPEGSRPAGCSKAAAGGPTRAKATGDTAVELMTAPAITVGPDASVAEAARRLAPPPHQAAAGHRPGRPAGRHRRAAPTC